VPSHIRSRPCARCTILGLTPVERRFQPGLYGMIQRWLGGSESGFSRVPVAILPTTGREASPQGAHPQRLIAPRAVGPHPSAAGWSACLEWVLSALAGAHDRVCRSAPLSRAAETAAPTERQNAGASPPAVRPL